MRVVNPLGVLLSVAFRWGRRLVAAVAAIRRRRCSRHARPRAFVAGVNSGVSPRRQPRVGDDGAARR